jgi:hypothetical protein
MSEHPEVLKNRLLRVSLLAFGLASTGCATQAPRVMIKLPQSLRAACDRAEVGPLATVGDLGALAVRQEAALSVCDGRREALVAIVDGYTSATDPPRFRWP